MVGSAKVRECESAGARRRDDRETEVRAGGLRAVVAATSVALFTFNGRASVEVRA